MLIPENVAVPNMTGFLLLYRSLLHHAENPLY